MNQRINSGIVHKLLQQVRTIFNCGSSMKREQKHFIGYWMTIIGFAFLVAAGVFSSYLELSADLGMFSAAAGFLIFLAGAELAHRNHESTASDSS